MVSNRLQAIIWTNYDSVWTHISALSGLDDTNSFTLLCGNPCLSNFQCDHGTLLYFWDVSIIIANHGLERRNRTSPELSTVCNLTHLVVCYWLVLTISFWISSVPLGQPCDCPNWSRWMDAHQPWRIWVHGLESTPPPPPHTHTHTHPPPTPTHPPTHHLITYWKQINMVCTFDGFVLYHVPCYPKAPLGSLMNK